MTSSLDFDSSPITVGPFRLHADRWDGGRAAHVLLLHGLGGNSITWHGVAPLLARKLQAHVLAVDLPGFGASRPGQRRISTKLLVDVVLRVMENEAPPGTRWIVAGNSLGGLLALALACRVPERVERVTLSALALPLRWGRERAVLSSFSRYVAVAVPFQGRRLVTHYIRQRGVPGIVDDPIQFLFRDPSRLDAELRQRLIGISEHRLGWAEEGARAYEQATRSLGIDLLSPRGAARWIREVRRPVQAIYGSHDPLFPVSAWRTLEQTRPDWEYVVMEDIGHVPQLEAPEQFAEHMLEWLARPHAGRAAALPVDSPKVRLGAVAALTRLTRGGAEDTSG